MYTRHDGRQSIIRSRQATDLATRAFQPIEDISVVSAPHSQSQQLHAVMSQIASHRPPTLLGGARAVIWADDVKAFATPLPPHTRRRRVCDRCDSVHSPPGPSRSRRQRRRRVGVEERRRRRNWLRSFPSGDCVCVCVVSDGELVR